MVTGLLQSPRVLVCRENGACYISRKITLALLKGEAGSPHKDKKLQGGKILTELTSVAFPNRTDEEVIIKCSCCTHKC